MAQILQTLSSDSTIEKVMLRAKGETMKQLLFLDSVITIYLMYFFSCCFSLSDKILSVHLILLSPELHALSQVSLWIIKFVFLKNNFTHIEMLLGQPKELLYLPFRL